jgi:chromosome segregation ATPase
MPDVDCDDLDKKNEAAKWAAREASSKEFDAFDKVTDAANEIKDAHDYFDETNMTDNEIIEAQIDLIETARQETADQIKEARDDWSDAHGAGAGNGDTSDRIDALNQEMKDLDNTEERLADLVDDWGEARDDHTEKSNEADQALEDWDEHCAPPDDPPEEPEDDEEDDGGEEPDGGHPKKPKGAGGGADAGQPDP